LSNSISVGRIGWHKCPDNERKAHAFHWTEWSHGPHEPLWSDELLEQIQIVRRRQLRGSNLGSLHNVYPLRRITICDRRNRTMYGEAPRSTLYIACGNQRERHDSGQSAVRRSRLGDQVGEC
jgi:hypothetical protein